MTVMPSLSKHLSQLFPESLRIINGYDPVIEGLSLDSREIKQNYLFIAKPGTRMDGRDFIEDAISNGASAVLSESCQEEQGDQNFSLHDSGCPVYFYKGIDEVLGEISKRFFSYSSEKMKVIAVTGTNGKSSICHFTAQALSLAGYKVAVLGTLGNGFLGQLEASLLTTTDVVNVHKNLAHFFQQGAQFVCMEVSSHSLDQGRVNGVDFDIAIFSNLSRDHLDYHHDMESYASAKEKLFHFPKLRAVAIKLDETGAGISKRIAHGVNKITVGDNENADIYVLSKNLDTHGLQVEFSFLNKSYLISNPNLLGQFNVDNLLLAFATLVHSGIRAEKACELLSQVQPVLGRMQKVTGHFEDSPLVVVDYAHTPDALDKALLSLKALKPKKLTLVFGCGGDRDKGKRALMAKVAEQYCEKIIVTSDNPRSENQSVISADILSGFSATARNAVIVENDREKAIAYALLNSKAHDVVLIAGKGHEHFQIIGDDKVAFDDVVISQKILKENFSQDVLGRNS